MEVATWILVIILAIFLLIFLIVGIVLLAKLIIIAKEAKKIVIQGQNIAQKANSVVGNVRNMTTLSGIVRNFTDAYAEVNAQRKKLKKKKGKDNE